MIHSLISVYANISEKTTPSIVSVVTVFTEIYMIPYYLLLEDEGFLLQENGGRIIL